MPETAELDRRLPEFLGAILYFRASCCVLGGIPWHTNRLADFGQDCKVLPEIGKWPWAGGSARRGKPPPLLLRLRLIIRNGGAARRGPNENASHYQLGAGSWRRGSSPDENASHYQLGASRPVNMAEWVGSFPRSPKLLRCNDLGASETWGAW